MVLHFLYDGQKFYPQCHKSQKFYYQFHQMLPKNLQDMNNIIFLPKLY